MLVEPFYFLFSLFKSSKSGTRLLEERPLRDELFSLEQLRKHARQIASQHELCSHAPSNVLLARLAENEDLLRVYNLKTGLIENNRHISPAAEWLLDNFYLIEEQIHITHLHFPQSYNRKLPHLATGPSAGFPRIYDIALQLVSHTDGRLDMEHLVAFIQAYQETTSLMLGELWAVPIMLRLALIENLRRVAVHLSRARRARDLAGHWADRILKVAEERPMDLILEVSDFARSNVELSSPFIAEFWRRLQGHAPSVQLALGWVEQKLTADGNSIEQLVHMESLNQATDQVSVGNSITSLRFLSSVDWGEFVEDLSDIEKVLKSDPAGVYPHMDFSTRDRCRHEVELLARKAKITQADVAQKAVSLANEAASPARNVPAAHVGFYLIGHGVPQLEDAILPRSATRRLLRMLNARRFETYLGSVLLFTFLMGVVFMKWCGFFQLGAAWQTALWLLTLISVSYPVVSFVNWCAALFVKPALLPRMDYSEGLPPECRTMVVIPTMLDSPKTAQNLITGLEMRYLANRDPYLHFALLTDFTDAAHEELPEDAAALRDAEEGVRALNRKYGSDQNRIFYLFHRPRRWNTTEQLWMGYERKRGKLMEFNALLRGRGRENFSTVVGDLCILLQMRYVITLDTDTELPYGVARELVGTLSHVLNRPRFDSQNGCITDGYTILQPRVGISLPEASRSLYVQLYVGDPGFDPYTRAVSDVYQDLFQAGSFIGKGIYDIDAFEKALSGRFPENRILSHDLIESCYARSGFVSDVLLYEKHPSRYTVDTSRRHRWMRGDWQILPWIFGKVPSTSGARVTNSLSALSRWKIFDNLRRSLIPPALMLLLLLNWFAFVGEHRAVTSFVLLILLIHPIFLTLTTLARRSRKIPFKLQVRGAPITIAQQIAQALFAILVLPYEAYLCLDAMIRTGHRIWISRRNLLSWETAGEAERRMRGDLSAFYRTMWIAPAVGTLLVLWKFFSGNAWMPLDLLLWGLWTASPLVAWALSLPICPPAFFLAPEQRHYLRKLARKTWAFFETFAGPEENWLAPDNFQEHPVTRLASRTSPTNMGLGLLTSLNAYDFGYLSLPKLLQRTELTLESMSKLERYRGHFYNWYDTRSLKPLYPLYISMVDSGNLAAHLVTLRSGICELEKAPIASIQAVDGLRDTLDIFLDHAGVNALSPELKMRAHQLLESQTASPVSIQSLYEFLSQFSKLVEHLISSIPTSATPAIQMWRRCLVDSCQDHLSALTTLAPWVLPEFQTIQNEEHEIVEAVRRLPAIPTLQEISKLDENLPEVKGEAGEWRRRITEAAGRARMHLLSMHKMADQCSAFSEMDFSFLYNEQQRLFSIGYNLSERKLDTGCYDLLASEARLGSFFAIARNQVSHEHWFVLGRLLTFYKNTPMLLSWSGSMFEYLMPLLVMPTYPDTILDRTYKGVVQRQIDYARQRGVPWGISESGFYLTDAWMNYQYRAFGVPGLGFKRGLDDDLVIAPYASAMGLMVEPESACRNLQRLSKHGHEGLYGLYEAIDYTPSRMPPGQTSATVRSFMAHHQGMTLLSIGHLLLERPMQRRFMADPELRTFTLLLQERLPTEIGVAYPNQVEANAPPVSKAKPANLLRIFTNPNLTRPETHLLSNGRYHVAITHTGGGYSRWNDLCLTRWREDATRDSWGMFCYLRDIETGQFWSPAFQPTLRACKFDETVFTQGRAEFRSKSNDVFVHADVCVSSEDDVELRRVTLTNHSRKPRMIELTTFAEVVLAPRDADLAHPSFSNLFVQTEFESSRQALLCTRRARSEQEHPMWLYHLTVPHGKELGKPSFETDRARFLGRTRGPDSPAAMQTAKLSGTSGSVLDPCISIRRTLLLEPDETATVDIYLGITDSRENALKMVEKYSDPVLGDRVGELAWTHSQVVLRHLNASEADAQMYGRLASALIYANPNWRADPALIGKNNRAQTSLWTHGISGDHPIVLLRITRRARIDLVKQAVQAHAYWRLKGLTVDLVILNEDDSLYRQTLHEEIVQLVSAGIEGQLVDKPGGIFVRRMEQIPPEDRVLLQSTARIVLTDEMESLLDQEERRSRVEFASTALVPVKTRTFDIPPEPRTQPELIYSNGYGGFTPDGREYIIQLARDKTTPAPWCNVLANPTFGTVISESGGAYTWMENSHEFRLTPWYNDPLCDTSGEAFYIRDETTGRFWSPTPKPARGEGSYRVRHGFGYSVFEHEEQGIRSELNVYVAPDAPVKFGVLKLRNRSGSARSLTATAYVEWVLGALREKNALHVVTELDVETGALFARNAFNGDFPGRVAFLDASEIVKTFTGDRTEFIGRNNPLSSPAAMKNIRLSGKTGAGLDPCGAVQTRFDLAHNETREVIFLLGCASTTAEARHLIRRFRGPHAARETLESIWIYWNETLGALRVETPDPALDLLANGWLLYQTQVSRLWARSGYYQSGGAYGFRDQLQDVMALVYSEPRLAREQIVRAARRQFREGDVQHWWHPPSGRGVRTHFSDDYLWLPFVTAHYVEKTGDMRVLDESLPFLESRLLRPEEESNYDLPQISAETATLYEHCARAIRNGFKYGAHGLPLIGCGDWNDGMNLIGKDGKGESVWLGFFLCDVLHQFVRVAERRGDVSFARECQDEAARIQRHLEENAWDGHWYRRAYFDNGEAIGSASSPECQIDSLPQSWAVISGASDPTRAAEAMIEVDRRLVKRDSKLILLFDPPFDRSPLNPGYIKGYVPGVRENGGQYTHAAIWTVLAFARLGDRRRAWELFSLINPILHAATPTAVELYRVEPYVMCADVYGAAPHTGRGGWTWYTGSAGWMYRLIIESLLGFQQRGETLHFNPCVPETWKRFVIHWRYQDTPYELEFLKAGDASKRGKIEVEGAETAELLLVNDRARHHARIFF